MSGGSGTVIPSIAANSIKDTFGNDNSASTSTDNTISYDVTVPTLAFGSVGTGNPGNSLTPTILGTTSEASTVTLYYDSACTAAKSTPVVNTAFAAPGITVTGSVNANASTIIYGKAVDVVGNVSVCTNLVTYNHDGQAPTVTNVSSSLANGYYKVGQVVPVQVTFSKVVYVTGMPQLTLATGASSTPVGYTSGSGTNTLTFAYTVFAGDNNASLDYGSTTSLGLNSGVIKDAVNNNAVLTLPAPSAAGSLSGNKAIAIDTNAPSMSYTSISPVSPGMTQTPQVTVNLSEAASNVRLYSDSGCSAAVSVAASGVSGSNVITTNALAANASTTFFGQMTDLAGNVSSCASMTSYLHDDAPATVASVSSTSANGTYRAGQSIPVTVNFSETVYVTGTPQLTLETGASDAVIDYVSGSGTSTLTFTYNVRLNDASSDLDYVSTAALGLNSGMIKDLAGNNATLTLAAVGSGNSLGGQKDIVIYTAPPVLAYTAISPATPGMSRTPAVGMTVTEASTVTLYSDSSCSTAISSAVAITTGAGQSVSTLTLPANSVTTIYARAVASFNNTSACTSMVVYTHDNVAPTVNSFVRASGQIASTNSLPANFTITFSEPITASSFTASDITNAGTSTGVVWDVVQVNSSTYTVIASAASNGTIIPRIVPAAVTDIAGNVSGNQYDATQTVAFTAATFTVTLNQAAGQVDPVNGLPINFTVAFSGAVGSSSFTTSDIVQTGTATGVTWALTTADNVTWNLAATAISGGSGTLVPTIAANTVVDE